MLGISLLRTPVYSAHPINDRPLADTDRAHDHIDIGEREFEYRITADNAQPDMQAEVYNQPCIALSFFPSGLGEKKQTAVEISNHDVIMTRLCQTEKGTLVRLFNSTDKPAKATLEFGGETLTADMGAFEVQTYIFADNKFISSDLF